MKSGRDMMLKMFQCLAFLALAAVPLPAASAKPAVSWASDPVRPDETVLVVGDGFRPDTAIDLDGQSSIKPLQVSDHSLKFVLPSHVKPGIFNFRVRCGNQVSAPVTLNAPDVWWMQGDEGESATPGGWLRLFGKCLSLDDKTPPQVKLKAPDGTETTFSPNPNAYALTINLPATLKPQDYEVQIHNGHGGTSGWRRAGRFKVIAPVKWKSDRFNVRDFGADSDKAIRAALDKARLNGGGVVYFPRGRYELKSEITVPPGTMLKGEGMALSSIFWSDLKTVPSQLIGGRDFGIENLAIYCTNHKNVIRVERQSNRFRMQRVRLRANAFFKLGDPGSTFHNRTAPPPGEKRGYAIYNLGRNAQITDCDIYASGTALGFYLSGWIGPTGPWHCLVARNRLAYGYFGTYFDNLDGMIFEDNELVGSGQNSGGNFVGTFSTRYSRNVYWAANHHHDIYGWDRESFSLDGAGGAYFGKLAKAKGTSLTLAGDPQYKDYQQGLLAQGRWPVELTRNWIGAAVMVMAGTGVGQYRTVVKNEGRNWAVDRPWDIPLDQTSEIAIAVDRGRILVIGNTFDDGGAVQLYGTALDVIVAGNKARRIDNFMSWAMHHKGWAWEPNFRCQFLDNEILEGNSYGRESSCFGATVSRHAGDEREFSGPLVRGLIFRRNVCHNNASFRLEDGVADALIEHCTIRHNEVGFHLEGGLQDVLLRDNTLEDVARPYEGDGVGKVLIQPAVDRLAPAQ